MTYLSVCYFARSQQDKIIASVDSLLHDLDFDVCDGQAYCNFIRTVTKINKILSLCYKELAERLIWTTTKEADRLVVIPIYWYCHDIPCCSPYFYNGDYYSELGLAAFYLLR